MHLRVLRGKPLFFLLRVPSCPSCLRVESPPRAQPRPSIRRTTCDQSRLTRDDFPLPTLHSLAAGAAPLHTARNFLSNHTRGRMDTWDAYAQPLGKHQFSMSKHPDAYSARRPRTSQSTPSAVPNSLNRHAARNFLGNQTRTPTSPSLSTSQRRRTLATSNRRSARGKGYAGISCSTRAASCRSDSCQPR
jgi:hypothetical protein